MLATVLALTGPGMDGRATDTPGGAKARAWIEARLRAIGVRPATGQSYAQPFSFAADGGGMAQGTNLVALCPGSDADAPHIVVSAHYDHLGVRNGATYPGADDNASGVALLLAVAERCVTTPFTHPLLLVAFDAEERGLQGARAFLANPPVPAARLALDVNFDMVGRGDRGEIYVAGPGRWPRLLPLLTPAVRQPGITVTFGHDTGGGHDDWTSQSDHGVFHDAGIPFVYFGVEDHADYHQPTDTADKIATAFLDHVAAVVFASLTALDRAPAYK
ncbi:MAG TPA: M28 family peptidase [Vicinamibacterales bacterium]|nr:M28 family peptidase [Vicinamibacterales bacterium]